MRGMKRAIGRGFIALGLVLLVIGLIPQRFSFSFKSGVFNSRVTFALSGSVTSAL